VVGIVPAVRRRTELDHPPFPAAAVATHDLIRDPSQADGSSITTELRTTSPSGSPRRALAGGILYYVGHA